MTIVVGAKAASNETFTITDIFDGTNLSATVTSPVAATLTTTAKASDAHSGKLGTDNQYFQLVLTSNKFTAASFNGYINTTSTDKNWAFQFTTNGGTSWSDEVTQANDGTKSAHDITVGVTIPENANGIRIVRKAGTSSYVLSITLTVASEGPEISADNVNISEDGTDEGEIVFSVEKKGTTGTVTASEEADWLTLGEVDNTNGKVPFTAEANTAQSSRSAVVTLTYTYDTNKTATKEVTVTQDGNLKGASLIKATIAATEATNSDATGTIGGKFSNKLQTVSEHTGYKFGGANHYVSLTLDGSNTFKEGDVINVHITEIADAGKTMQIFDGTGSGKSVVYEKETRGEVGNNFFVLPAEANGKSTLAIIRTNSSDACKWNAFIDYIEVIRPNATITLNANGYATYSNAEDFEFAGADAYGMTLTTEALSSTKVTSGKVAAGEGVLFKGEANAKVAIINTTGAEEISDNDLMGTTPATGDAPAPDYTNHKYFVLKGNQFVPYQTASTFAANKAYFEVAKDFSAQSLDITFDDAPTAVEAVAEAKVNVNVPVKVIKNGQLFIGNYNVAGQQVK
ncbi:MAG: BACON domain-containing protein [Prevotella sp.]|nr:BACON domain-containing protein [Prevotella sp.]